MKKVEGYVAGHFAKRGADFAVKTRTEGTLAIRVEGIKGEILRDKQYWEHIEFYFAQVPLDQAKSNLLLIIDAQYASGINRPDQASYLDVQPQYSGSLQEYGSIFLTSLTKQINPPLQ
jgi:hypothetical protein